MITIMFVDKRSKISLIITIILIFSLSFLIIVAVKMIDSCIFCLLQNACFLHTMLRNPLLLRCLLFIYAIDLDGLQVVIGALGIAGGILSAITAVKLRRVNGILLDEVLNCYFPLYWVMFAFNCVFVALGQYCCIAGQALSSFICFIGAFLCLMYIIVVGAATAFSEKAANLLTSWYTKKLAKILSPARKCKCAYVLRKRKELRSKIIGSIGEHVASQLEKTTASFHISQGIEQQVRAILKICGDSNSSDDYSLIKDFTYSFSKGNIPLLPCEFENAVYYELPFTEAARNSFCEQMGLAYEMWKSILSPLHETGRAAQAACRILFIYVKQNKRRSFGHISAICCGLVVYLYRYFCSDKESTDCGTLSRCAEFVYEMERIIDSELQQVAAAQQDADTLLRFCGEMMTLLLTMVNTEQYFSTTVNNKSVDLILELLRRLHYRKDGIGISVNLVEEHITRYLCYTTLIFNRLPSVAARAQTIRQKRKIKAYVVAMMSLQLRRKGL